jgi:pyrroline-5-carboxylate reductase
MRDSFQSFSPALPVTGLCYDTSTIFRDGFMRDSTIAVIGGGNMGTCLALGLLADHFPAERLWMSNPTLEKLTPHQKKSGVNITSDNLAAASNADIIILAVKPVVMPEVLAELTELIQEHKPLIISTAAGVRATSIQQQLGGNIAIARAMPNTPALIGAGATGLFVNNFVSVAQRNLVESIFRAVGLIVWLDDEKLLDTVTALAGSGPAYYFLFMECMQSAAEQLGLPVEAARLLTLQTAFGATRMALESDSTLKELRQRVTSPKGTTERALQVFTQQNLSGIVANALQAAKLRAEELADLFDSAEKKNA